MKTFKEYLTESKKTYNFKVKVAGPLPENFEDGLKTRLGRCGVLELKKTATTPVQSMPIDFPQLKNMEVSVFEVMCEYPVIAPEVRNEVLLMGVPEAAVRVHNLGDPQDEAQAMMGASLTDTNLLQDEKYKEAPKSKFKDFWGTDYNKSFLKDLQKASKERKKEQGQKDNTVSSKGAQVEFDGKTMSPVGSHQNKIPDPYKG